MKSKNKQEENILVVSSTSNVLENKHRYDQLDLEKDFYKKRQAAESQLYVHNYKRYTREFDRLQKKGQYERVEINGEGIPTAITVNTYVNLQPHRITNFIYPQLTKLTCCVEPTQSIYLFECLINLENKSVFLDGKKIGNSKYLLQRLATIGVNILAPSESCAKDYVTSLFSNLIANYTQAKILPPTYGWYTNDKEELFFSKKGEMTWTTIKESILH